jgi:hypothetical protein
MELHSLRRRRIDMELDRLFTLSALCLEADRRMRIVVFPVTCSPYCPGIISSDGSLNEKGADMRLSE